MFSPQCPGRSDATEEDFCMANPMALFEQLDHQRTRLTGPLAPCDAISRADQFGEIEVVDCKLTRHALLLRIAPRL
jgi:hypothetical protein